MNQEYEKVFRIMTVGELIAELNKHPHDRIVLVNAYEEGFDEVEKVVNVKTYFKPKKNYWEGNYPEYPLDECLCNAVLIPRP